MSIFPDGYKPVLSVKDTQKAIEKLRDYFQDSFAVNLNLHRVSAPLFVRTDTGLNDNLSGTEKAVSFDVSALKVNCEIVHSLAKWKRMALGKYGYAEGEGIYTNMNAIRRDEERLDNLHSIYVDQWDWEKVISDKDRTINYLETTVKAVYRTIRESALFVEHNYSELKCFLPEEITFITSEELLQKYPDMTATERENAFAKECGAIFVIGIGDKLSDGAPHDKRAADYDDWTLNGDILVWYSVLNRAVELSSMGIRVDKAALIRQLAAKGVSEYTDYHKAILNGEYPLTIGGGIGQSRVCQVLLGKAHIGEVQSSIWSQETYKECADKDIELL